MKLVIALVPSVGSMLGEMVLQSVAHITLALATTIPVNVTGVRVSTVTLLGEMEVIVVGLVAGITVRITPVCSTTSPPPSNR